MHRCLQIPEILSIIFQYAYHPRSRKTLARLARTCTAFQDFALNILWRAQFTFLPLLKCLPRDAWIMNGEKFSITRNLTASDFERIYFYCHRIRYFSPSSGNLEAQVLPVIWSRKPSPGPLLCNVSEVNLDGESFNGPAIQPRLIVGPHIKSIWLRVPRDSFSWGNLTAMLRKAAPLHLSKFALIGSVRSLSWSEAESLELLLALRGVKTLDIDRIFLASSAISMISTFPALEDLHISATEQEMESYTLSVGGDTFPALSHLAITSKTLNTCQLMLAKIQSKMVQSLTVTRTAHDRWNVRRLFKALHAHNLASGLETLHVGNCSGADSSSAETLFEHSFKIDARTFGHLDSFEHLRDLQIEPSSVDLDDNDLLKLAKSLPQLRSLVFFEVYDSDNVPKCTFTGMQHLIQFCPKLAKLTLCIDAREISIFAAQPDGEYPFGLHLADLNLRNSPVSNVFDVASYLIMLLPALRIFSTAHTDGSPYLEEFENDSYREIWLDVEELLDSVASREQIF